MTTLDFAEIICTYISHMCLKLFILSSTCMKEQSGPRIFQSELSQQNDPRMTTEQQEVLASIEWGP